MESQELEVQVGGVELELDVHVALPGEFVGVDVRPVAPTHDLDAVGVLHVPHLVVLHQQRLAAQILQDQRKDTVVLLEQSALDGVAGEELVVGLARVVEVEGLLPQRVHRAGQRLVVLTNEGQQLAVQPHLLQQGVQGVRLLELSARNVLHSVARPVGQRFVKLPRAVGLLLKH